MQSSRRSTALLTAVGLTLAASFTSVCAEPAKYVSERQHTNVSFSWNHLGLSKQTGRIIDVEATLLHDPEKPEESTLEVVMKPASMMTGVADLDRQLKGADYFDAGRHPTITFKSTGIKKTGEKSGEVVGDLTILGITKPVTLDVTLNFSGEHPLAPLNATYRDQFAMGFSAKAKISRSEWGLKRGTPLVSDEIEISIETEMIRR